MCGITSCGTRFSIALVSLATGRGKLRFGGTHAARGVAVEIENLRVGQN